MTNAEREKKRVIGKLMQLKNRSDKIWRELDFLRDRVSCLLESSDNAASYISDAIDCLKKAL